MLRRANHLFPHFGAFESTKIHGSGTDLIESTGHLTRWREDLDMLSSAGIRDLRYPVPWHRIEPAPGSFDFSWIDQPLSYILQQGINPVVDLLHHTSFPDWLENGFANPEFPERFKRFVEQFARRYEWVRRYTIFNEPLATTLLCSYSGTWYPHRRSERAFVRMTRNVARAIHLADRAVRHIRPDFESVYIDTCEHHTAQDRNSRPWVEFANNRRFLILDMVRGKIGARHPLFKYLRNNGLDSRDLHRFRDEPVPVDILGLDYYPHSELNWFWDTKSGAVQVQQPFLHPRGFADVAGDYIERYRLPVMLAETNIRGTVSDRITWLRFMQEQCEDLVRNGTDFRGFCWFPSIDSTDWSNLCVRYTGEIDPQGIWYLDGSRSTRFPSELSCWYSQLASGLATAQDLPAYCFLPPLDRQLSGFLGLMSHWDRWLEPGDGTETDEEAAA